MTSARVTRGSVNCEKRNYDAEEKEEEDGAEIRMNSVEGNRNSKLCLCSQGNCRVRKKAEKSRPEERERKKTQLATVPAARKVSCSSNYSSFTLGRKVVYLLTFAGLAHSQ